MIKICGGPRCGREFYPVSQLARFCSDRCRKAASRLPVSPAGLDARRAGPPPGWESHLAEACRRERAAAGRLDTAFGVAALILAERIDCDGWAESGRGLAGVCKELAAAMDRALGPLLVEPNVRPIKGRR